MGVFEEHGGVLEGSKLYPKDCKRNYEKEIEAVKLKQQYGLRLINALVDYIDHHGTGNKQFTLTELYGSLKLEERDFEKTAQFLMEQWEKEKGES